jgi:hypothetical protein
MVIIKRGDVYYGPFDNSGAAVAWADEEFGFDDDLEWEEIELTPPRYPDKK